MLWMSIVFVYVWDRHYNNSLAQLAQPISVVYKRINVHLSCANHYYPSRHSRILDIFVCSSVFVFCISLTHCISITFTLFAIHLVPCILSKVFSIIPLPLSDDVVYKDTQQHTALVYAFIELIEYNRAKFNLFAYSIGTMGIAN